MRGSRFKGARRSGNGGLTLFTALGIAGLACLLAGWNAHAPRNAGLSPAEVIALRFPDPRNDVFDNVADARAEATPAEAADARKYSLFSPYPTMAQPVPAPATYQVASLGSTPVVLAPRPSAPARESRASGDARPETRPETKPAAKADTKPAAVHPKPAAPRNAKRPGAVLSESQIASIKSRLNLTADQQEMWPAVEQALRSLSYARKEDGVRGVQSAMRTAEIDTSSEEVQRLKSAAFPLIMSFSDEQKRELRILAHVAGLEKLATQF